ncbi:MAG: DUF1667 domain-containing protein [Patescibacteria group bacterium]
MEETSITCIICPMGCEITVRPGPDGGEPDFSGNRCRRGLDYARSEALDPRRVLTTTVRVRGGELPVVPVRTSLPVAKGRLFELMRIVAGLEVKAPVKIGAVLVSDLDGRGADLVACRDLPASNASKGGLTDQ